MTTIPGEIVKHVESTGQLAYIDLNADSKALEVGPSRQGSLTSAIEKLSRTSDRLEEGMATRVTVHELGSLDWGEITSHVRSLCLFTSILAEVDRDVNQGIHRFLHSLRSIIRNKSASALVTLPSHLARSPPPGCGLSKEAWIKSLAWAVDGCIELRGFGGTSAFACIQGLAFLIMIMPR